MALAQPVVLGAVGKLATDLPAAQRPTGIALGSAGSFVGRLAAVLLGPSSATTGTSSDCSSWRPRSPSPRPRTVTTLNRAHVRRPPTQRSRGTLWATSTRCGPYGRCARCASCAAYVFVGFGVFVAIATWLQALLEPDGVSDQAAGTLLVAMIVAGVAGCAILPRASLAAARSPATWRRPSPPARSAACALGVAPWIGVRAAILVAVGLLLLPALPILLTAAEQLAGPAAGTAGAIVWMAGNLGGLVVALIVQILLHHPLAAFVAMGAVSLLAAPLATRIARSAREEGQGQPPAVRR